MCVFGKVSLSVLLRVLGEYWMCLLDQVSLSVLWRVLDEYWMSVFGKVSFECFTAGIGCVYLMKFC
jgi:hypothetical protein